MSQQSILEKSLQIRNETQEYANTRGRVADVLVDINETKANRTEVTEEIDEAIEALNIGSKMDRPTWDGSVKYYLVKSDAGANNLQEMTLSANRVPVWSGNNLVDSPVYVSPGRIGIGAASVSEVLEVTGNVKANAVILPVNSTSAIANRLRSDGTIVYYSNGSSVEKKIAFDENGVNVSVIHLSATSINISVATDINGLKMHGKSIIHENTTNTTITVVAMSDFICKGLKASTGNITFVAGTDITIIQADSTLTVNGGKGSSYVLERLTPTEYLLSIKNI